MVVTPGQFTHSEEIELLDLQYSTDFFKCNYTVKQNQQTCLQVSCLLLDLSDIFSHYPKFESRRVHAGMQPQNHNFTCFTFFLFSLFFGCVGAVVVVVGGCISLLVNFSVTPPLGHLPCQSIIGLKTWLRNLQTMFLNQFNKPGRLHIGREHVSLI